LALVAQQPPHVLFHGTATRFIESIRGLRSRSLRDRGLLPGSRQHVHLSLDEITALKVGQRHGKPIVLKIWAKKMYEAGFKFFRADNGVWLTNYVPSDYMEFPQNNR
jgi:putative RNA 2'-phosphotransferase